ncbi:hypothetical protein EG68_07347 [Paragonimus skrjabini miyazakii]|uniref:Uncharacterized protein n=1 Tax=Paragonimus skrjabini miyazakii TaxID=59628 RepID=A0A8S9YV85_9TREM|nr:hypothetical protein EG68_07347 [Paragonimus skrjabini miyazakii]
MNSLFISTTVFFPGQKRLYTTAFEWTFTNNRLQKCPKRLEILQNVDKPLTTLRCHVGMHLNLVSSSF